MFIYLVWTFVCVWRASTTKWDGRWYRIDSMNGGDLFSFLRERGKMERGLGGGGGGKWPAVRPLTSWHEDGRCWTTTAASMISFPEPKQTRDRYIIDLFLFCFVFLFGFALFSIFLPVYKWRHKNKKGWGNKRRGSRHRSDGYRSDELIPVSACWRIWMMMMVVVVVMVVLL